MSAPTSRLAEPRTELGPGPAGHRRRGLALAVLLAALAGMVDGIGFLRLGHLYVSYMSGNSTQMALAAGRWRLDEAGAILVLVGLFVVGAAGGQILSHLFGRRHLTAVLAVVVMLLAMSAALDTATKPMVLAMGILNSAMHRAGDIPVNLTFVTGTLVRFGQGLGDFAIGRADGWVWLQQAVPWLGLIAGAALAGALSLRIGAVVDWVPVGLASALLLWSVAIAEQPL
ncbi:MAG TPA: DUF1275 family protein [Stellaceae bacterium]|nr:DUF1275 family protein [Stellaceae bacterium]